MTGSVRDVRHHHPLASDMAPQKKLTGQAPSEKVVAGWIDAAKALPKKITH